MPSVVCLELNSLAFATLGLSATRSVRSPPAARVVRSKMKGNNGMLQIRPRQSNLCLPLVLACLGLATAGGVAAAGTFDGVYRGTQRTTLTNNSGECAHIDNNNAALQIQNNHFTRV